MAEDHRKPSRTSNTSQAGAERWESEPDTVERRERERRGQSEEGGGITRPVGEEVENQRRVPERGSSRHDGPAQNR